jgi:heme A synthase
MIAAGNGIDFLAIFLCFAAASLLYWRNWRDRKVLVAAQDRLTNKNKIRIMMTWIYIIGFLIAGIYFIVH